MTVDKIAVDKITVDKITWDRVGRVTEPGRYMYTFGWLTISAGDLDIWKQYPQAAFTLLAHRVEANDAVGEEFHLGPSTSRPTCRRHSRRTEGGSLASCRSDGIFQLWTRRPRTCIVN